MSTAEIVVLSFDAAILASAVAWFFLVRRHARMIQAQRQFQEEIIAEVERDYRENLEAFANRLGVLIRPEPPLFSEHRSGECDACDLRRTLEKNGRN